MEYSHQKRTIRIAKSVQKNLTKNRRRNQLLRHDLHPQKYFFIYSAAVQNFNDERRDLINKDIAQKEIRVLDMTVLLNYAAQIKK